MELLYTAIVWAFKSLWPLPFLVVVLGCVVYLFIRPESPSVRNTIAFVTLIIAVLILSLTSFLGHLVTVPIINNIGIETQGLVISEYKTGDIYNEREVIGFKVIYQLASGELIESHYKSSDFNVYPITNNVRYPGQGSVFRLKYLEKMPQYFVILRD